MNLSQTTSMPQLWSPGQTPRTSGSGSISSRSFVSQASRSAQSRLAEAEPRDTVLASPRSVQAQRGMQASQAPGAAGRRYPSQRERNAGLGNISSFVGGRSVAIQTPSDMVMDFERAQLPEGLEPEVGMGLQMQGPQGQPVPVQIIAVAEENITIDANHPLAGQNLNFELELVEVN